MQIKLNKAPSRRKNRAAELIVMHTYMWIKYPFLILLSFLIASCGHEASFIDHERKVYKALLSHMGGDEAKLLIIKEMSVHEHRLGPDEFLKEKNEIEAYREYIAINVTLANYQLSQTGMVM